MTNDDEALACNTSHQVCFWHSETLNGPIYACPRALARFCLHLCYVFKEISRSSPDTKDTYLLVLLSRSRHSNDYIVSSAPKLLNSCLMRPSLLDMLLQLIAKFNYGEQCPQPVSFQFQICCTVACACRQAMSAPGR